MPFIASKTNTQIPTSTIKTAPGSPDPRRAGQSNPRRILHRTAIIAWVIFSLPGCRLPDATPFADATTQLKSAVAITGATVVNELRMIDAAQQADQLSKDWDARNAAFAAMAHYAASLQEIVAAGLSGAESAGKVADALKQFAGSLNVTLPVGGAVGVAADAARFVYAQIALIQASRSLEQALQLAQPAVEQLAGLIKNDLQDIDDVFQAVNKIAEINWKQNNNDRFAYRAALEQELFVTDAEKLRDEKQLARLAQLSRLLHESNGWYLPLQNEFKQLKDRLRSGRQAIALAKASCDLWASQHAQLAPAIRQGRTLDAQSLVLTALELRQLIQRMREL